MQQTYCNGTKQLKQRIMKTFKVETKNGTVTQPLTAITPFIPASKTPYTIEMALEDCQVGGSVDWTNKGEQVKATRIQ